MRKRLCTLLLALLVLLTALPLAAAEGWYEAFLLEDSSFALYVPETSLTGQVSIIYTARGRVWALETAI